MSAFDLDIQTGPAVAKVCSFEGCGRTAMAKGMCGGHRGQQRRGEQLRPLTWGVERPCGFDGCGRRARAKGLCRSHWRQQHEGRPLCAIYRGRRKIRVLAADDCPRCKREKKEPGRSACRPCLDKVTRDTVARRTLLINDGKCPTCGDDKAEGDGYHCRPCRDYVNLKDRIRRGGGEERRRPGRKPKAETQAQGGV